MIEPLEQRELKLNSEWMLVTKHIMYILIIYTQNAQNVMNTQVNCISELYDLQILTSM